MTDPWEELVPVALMGTERRPLDVDTLPDGVREPASRLDATAPEVLLAAASLVHVAERAGARGPETEPIGRAPADATAEVAGPAAATLARLLQGEDRALLAEWLTVAAATGHHAPHRHLPTLLELARTHADRLRVPVAGALGERGRWLAALRPEWDDVLTAARREADVPDPWGGRERWTHGDLADRIAWLRAARESDPALAREELRSSWSSQAADERARLLSELRTGLGPDDEELLETALDDRRGEVRRVASHLLALLPGSAYSQRMLARATSWVRLERSLLRTRLVVEPVDELDASLKRDQVSDPPKGSGGRRAYFLTQVLACVPLRELSLALEADASRIVALAAASDWSMSLLSGLSASAQRSGDVDWCRALVEHDAALHVLLIAHLPAADQARAIRSAGPQMSGDLTRLAQQLPRPWSTEVALAVVEATGGMRALHPSTPQLLLDAAAHAAPADAPGPVIDALRARVASFEPGSALWSAASAALDVLTTRHRLREELT